MNAIRLRRPLVAVATAVACLVAFSLPAAATSRSTVIDSGTVAFAKTGGLNEALDLSPMPVCSGNDTMTVSTPTSTTIATPAFDWMGLDTTFGYQDIVTLTGSTFTPGSLNTTAKIISNMQLSVDLDTYSTANFDCNITGAPFCRLTFTLTLSGTYTGTLGVGDTLTLVGSSTSVALVSGCSPVYDPLVGTTVTVPATDPLTTTITAVTGTTRDMLIGGGAMNLTKTGVNETIDLGPPPSPCPIGAMTVDDTTSTTMTTTALDWVGNETLFVGALAVLTRSPTGNSAGTLNTTTRTVTNMSIGVRLDVYVTQTPDCSITGTRACRLNSTLTLSGTYTGTLGVGDTLTLGGLGTNLALGGGCASPFTTFVGSTVTIPGTDPLVLTVT